QLIGPQRHAVEEVDEAVAVGAEERQVGGALEERLREAGALGARGLREPRGGAPEAAGAARGERPGGPWALAARGGGGGGVRGCRRKLGGAAVVVLLRARGAAGMNAPHLPGVADDASGGLDGIRPGAADQRDAARREQALQRARRAHEPGLTLSPRRREPGASAASAAPCRCSSASAALTSGGKG